AAGLVSFAGTVPTSGRAVTIQTPSGLVVTLTNLGTISVEKGAAVAEGDVVGTAGTSGTPEFPVPYVHLGIRDGANEQGYLDPLQFLPPAPSAPPASPAPAPAPAAAPAPPAPAAPAVPAAPADAASPPAEPAQPAPLPAPAAAPAPAPAAVPAPAPFQPAVPQEASAPAGGLRVVAPAAAAPAAPASGIHVVASPAAPVAHAVRLVQAAHAPRPPAPRPAAVVRSPLVPSRVHDGPVAASATPRERVALPHLGAPARSGASVPTHVLGWSLGGLAAVVLALALVRRRRPPLVRQALRLARGRFAG